MQFGASFLKSRSGIRVQGLVAELTGTVLMRDIGTLRLKPTGAGHANGIAKRFVARVVGLHTTE